VVGLAYLCLHESHRNGYSGYSGLEKIVSYVGNTTAIIRAGRCYPAGCLLIDSTQSSVIR
jgi:hypothetical protein